jgi:hypothetical protein
MPKDPRTLKDVVEVAECHLIPDWSGASNKTVPLEKKIDNDIGTFCDAELKRYLNSLIGTKLAGKVAMKGGAKSLNATFNLEDESLETAPGNNEKKKEDKAFEDRALAAVAGEATLEAFKGTPVDGHYAYASAIHSAFLILHALGNPAVFEPMFDDYRALFDSASKKQLSEPQRTLIETTVQVVFFVKNQKKPVPKPIHSVEIKADGDPREAAMAALRSDYDPDVDPGDGLLAEFPTKSVEESADAIVVTVPYSKSLRAIVRFPKTA